MGAVTSGRNDSPKPAHHFLPGDAAPELREIALIAALVYDHRLAESSPPFGNPGQLPGLYGGVGDIGTGGVPKSEAVVIGEQMPVRVVRRHKCLNFLLIPGRHMVEQIVFVGQAPPDVGKRAEAAQEIVKIGQISLLPQPGKSPPVIGVEQDQIRLDPQPIQMAQILLKGVPEGKTWAVHIPVSVLILFKGVERRVVVVILVVLRVT